MTDFSRKIRHHRIYGHINRKNVSIYMPIKPVYYANGGNYITVLTALQRIAVNHGKEGRDNSAWLF
jgi:hypothetical protein